VFRPEGSDPFVNRGWRCAGNQSRITSHQSQITPQMLHRFLSLFALTALAGCATVTDGTRQAVTFQSTPAGARVVINDAVRGTTPCTLGLPRRGGYRVRFELSGYEPFEAKLVRKWNDNATMNGAFLGYPLAIDAATGAMFQLDLSSKDRRRAEEEGWDAGARLLDPDGSPEGITLTVATVLRPLARQARVQ
jgi:hypothetical protein